MTITEFRTEFPKIELRCAEEYLEKVLTFAEKRGKLADLKDRLERLNGFPGGSHLFKDYAPYSFEFAALNSKGHPMLIGGLLYYGAGDSGVGGPTYSVRLEEATEGWELHS